MAGAEGDVRVSLLRAGAAVRTFVVAMTDALRHGGGLLDVLERLGAVVRKTCRRDRRSKAGTIELLNDVGLLDFGLT